MASDPSRSFVDPLPAHPNLESQRKRAKALLRDAWDGDADGWRRIEALHPAPPARDAIVLADAQLVIARGYGFESWAALKHKIESLTLTPLERFARALREKDAAQLRALLESHAEVRAAVNAPIGDFDSRPIVMVKDHLPLVDLLIAFGADINMKSAWWAGGFGILELCAPAQAAALIARGATVDIWAAAHLGSFDRLRELVERDPSLVHARGGDGKTALHYSRSVEMAQYLVDRGADLDARCVDHESTPAQYLVREAPDVTRFLLSRGAWFDVYMAIGLCDLDLLERALDTDPGALDHRTGQRAYAVAHDGKQASTPEQRAGRRGDIYRWVFGQNFSPVDVARVVGCQPALDRLLRGASPAQRLIAAVSLGDRAGAASIVAAHPHVIDGMPVEQKRLVADRAQANDAATVMLLIDLGFDPNVPGPEHAEAIRWGAFHGNADIVRACLPHNPPLNVPDAMFNGTPLGWCVYGSVHGWNARTGDYVTTARLLIEAGDRIDPTSLPSGRDDVDRVLREYLKPR
jgi:hypothetical protein